MQFRRRILIIFLCAIAIRVFFSLFWFVNDQPLFSTFGDAPTYISTATNLLEKGIWSASHLPDPKPDNFRAPIYPLILAFFFHFDIPLDFLVFFQDILMAITFVFVYVFGRRLFSENVSFISALVLALDPYLASSFVSKSIMTEPLGLFFLVFALFNLALFIKEKKDKSLCWSAVFLGLGALVKPQFVAFSLFLFIAILLRKKKASLIKFFVTSYAIFFLIISPWLYYNFFVLHTTQFSSVSHVTIFDIAYRFDDWRNSTHSETYRERGVKMLEVEHNIELFEPHNAAILAKDGINLIKKTPLAFCWYQFIHIPRLFYDDTTVETIAYDFNIAYELPPGEMDVNVLKDFFRFKFKQAFSSLVSHPIWFVSLGLKIIHLLLMLLAFAYFFLVWLWQAKMSRVALFFLLFLCLYAIMITPVGLHRYRVPIEPIIFLLSFSSIAMFYKKLKRKVT